MKQRCLRRPRRHAQKQELLRKRKVIVQPIFGVIKQPWASGVGRCAGWRTFAPNGRCWARPFNLKKMYKAWAAGELALAGAFMPDALSLTRHLTLRQVAFTHPGRSPETASLE
jgi:hypothetical protein